MKETLRDYMNLAYEEMLKTKEDIIYNTESTPPLVGAVIVAKKKGKPEILKAHRCQMRDGQHAEETVIDVLNQTREFDGTEIMFTTLEPCTPESRSADKKCCATRIVEAGIKNVYIGMLDPNPNVYMKGVQYLLENHVSVTFFDEDITDKIKNENSDFIHSFGNNDTRVYLKLNKELLPKLSEEAIEYYCSENKIDLSEHMGLFWDFLIDKKLVIINKKDISVDDFVYIAFGENPSKCCDGAEVTLSVRMSTNNLKNNTGEAYERKDSYTGPMLLAYKKVKAFSEEYLPESQKRSGDGTKYDLVIPKLTLREAFINSIVHRAYSGELSGGFNRFTITDDSVTISNPCKLSESDVLQLKQFDKKPLSPNPLLARIFQKTNMVQRDGFGMDTFKKSLVQPLIDYDGKVLSISFPYSQSNALQAINEKNPEVKLNKDDFQVLQYIRNRKEVTREMVEKEFALPSRTAAYKLRKLIDGHYIKRKGEQNSPTAKYFAI